MKPKISLLAAMCFILFIQQSGAQSNVQIKFNEAGTELRDTQPVVCKVIYSMKFVPDTTKKDSTVKELFELDLGKTAGMYMSYTKRLKDSAVQNEIKEQMKQYIGTDGKFNSGGKPVHFDLSGISGKYPSVTAEKFYTSASDNGYVLNLQSLAGSNFLIKDTASKIDWQIQDSTKNIQGNLCQKAIGESHGRTYTAWFCSDIPYSFGPRRLHGLPGLILEAYDDKNEIAYTLESIQTNITNEETGLPKDGIYSTAQEFNKAKTAFEKNPEAFINSHNNSPNAKVFKVVVGSPAPGGKVDGFKNMKPNNPIDLK